MNDFMRWEECERTFIRHVTPDKEKIQSVLDTAAKRRKYIESQKADKETVSFIVEGYYEIIKELLIALLLKNGLKSKNHQCMISYFYRNFPDYEFEAALIAQMCYLRNRLSYYGEIIDKAFYDKNKEDMQKTIDLLLSLIKS